MSIFRRRKTSDPSPAISTKELDLAAAEVRSIALVQKAEWLRTAVTRRDQDNHWQDSVNSLFLGGTR